MKITIARSVYKKSGGEELASDGGFNHFTSQMGAVQ